MIGSFNLSLVKYLNSLRHLNIALFDEETAQAVFFQFLIFNF